MLLFVGNMIVASFVVCCCLVSVNRCLLFGVRCLLVAACCLSLRVVCCVLCFVFGSVSFVACYVLLVVLLLCARGL